MRPVYDFALGDMGYGRNSLAEFTRLYDEVMQTIIAECAKRRIHLLANTANPTHEGGNVSAHVYRTAFLRTANPEFVWREDFEWRRRDGGRVSPPHVLPAGAGARDFPPDAGGSPRPLAGGGVRRVLALPQPPGAGCIVYSQQFRLTRSAEIPRVWMPRTGSCSRLISVRFSALRSCQPRISLPVTRAMSDADDRTKRNAAPEAAEKWPRAVRGIVAVVLAVAAWLAVFGIGVLVWRSF